MKKNTNRSLYFVSVLSEVIDARLRKALKKIGHHQLSPRDLGILVSVTRDYGGQMDLKDVYSNEMRPKSSVSDIAKRLEKNGYLTKQSAPDNAKKIVLVANKKAHELFELITIEITQIVNQLYDGFTDEEKLQLMDLTTRAYENLTGEKLK
jgi:DNA-binding MarR family transcriptional regulator